MRYLAILAAHPYDRFARRIAFRMCVRSFTCRLLLLLTLSACASRKRAEIAVEPDRVDFGRLGPGEIGHRIVLVRSRGEVPLRVVRVEIVDDPSGLFTVDAPSGALIPEGGTLAIGVAYRARGEGALDTARLRISSDADRAPQVIVALSGGDASSQEDGGAFDDAPAGDTGVAGPPEAGGGDTGRADALTPDADLLDAAPQDSAPRDTGSPSDAGVDAGPCQGLNISPPDDLNTNADSDLGHDTLPHVATNGSGTWIVVWSSTDSLGGTIGTDGDILFTRSVDNGTTWSAPSYVNPGAPSDDVADLRPRVASGGGAWIVVWNIPQLGAAYSARSLDDGLTWIDPVEVGEGGVEPDDDRAPDIASDGTTFVAVWSGFLSMSGGGNVFSARSFDKGFSWQPEVAITSNGLSEGAPRVVYSSGVFMTVFHGHLAPNADGEIMVSRSVNNGEAWSAADALNTDAASDSIDDRQPAIAADGASGSVVVWGEQAGPIYTSRSLNNGVSWSSRRTLAEPGFSETTPAIATDGIGQWVAIWHATVSTAPAGPIGSDGDVIGAGSNSIGAAWSSETLINSTAAIDTGMESEPELAGDGRGNWIFVWSSNEGGDFDLAFARGACF